MMARKTAKEAAKKVKKADTLKRHVARRGKTLMAAINAVLAEHDVPGHAVALHLAPLATGATSAADANDDCPPGQIKKFVATSGPDGSTVIEKRCVNV